MKRGVAFGGRRPYKRVTTVLIEITSYLLLWSKNRFLSTSTSIFSSLWRLLFTLSSYRLLTRLYSSIFSLVRRLAISVAVPSIVKRSLHKLLKMEVEVERYLFLDQSSKYDVISINTVVTLL
jgi:hypothetical protein